MLRDSPASFPDELSLYEILQVSSKASPEVIQAAYRVLARTYHPDVSTASDAEERTRRLNAAHAILSDPGRRAVYDVSRTQAERRGAERRRRAEPSRAPYSAARTRSHVVDRPIGAMVVLWAITASVAVTIVVAVLLMLWSLFDALDSPGGSTIPPPGRIGSPQQTPWTPPFNLKPDIKSR